MHCRYHSLLCAVYSPYLQDWAETEIDKKVKSNVMLVVVEHTIEEISFNVFILAPWSTRSTITYNLRILPTSNCWSYTLPTLHFFLFIFISGPSFHSILSFFTSSKFPFLVPISSVSNVYGTQNVNSWLFWSVQWQ